MRIDFISSRLSKRTNAIIDSLGIVVFLIPLCVILIDLSWPFFMRAYVSGEMSENAGGLIRWPVILLIPVGFAILLAAGRVGADQAHRLPDRRADEPFSYGHDKTAEEELVEELAAKRRRARRRHAS